jgi:hypothetical protein
VIAADAAQLVFDGPRPRRQYCESLFKNNYLREGPSLKRRDKEKLQDFIDRAKAMKWPKIKPVSKAEQRFIATVLDAVNTLELEIIYGNVPAELPPDSAAYLPTAPQIELNLKIIKDNLYPLIELLRHLEPKQHKAALKHMRNLLDAVGYSWWIVPGEDLAGKERDENWQRRRWAKDSEAREALAAIVINIAGNKRPLHPYDWIGKKLRTINNKLIRVGHSPLVANFDDAKDVRKASDEVHRILTDLPGDLSRS